MAEPVPTAAPAGKGPWAKLNPKQKRIAAIAAIAAVLALAYFVLRGRGGTEEEKSTSEEAVRPSAAVGSPGEGGETAGLIGQLGENLGEEIATLGAGLGESEQHMGEQGASAEEARASQEQRLDEFLAQKPEAPNSPPLGESPAAKPKKPKSKAPFDPAAKPRVNPGKPKSSPGAKKPGKPRIGVGRGRPLQDPAAQPRSVTGAGGGVAQVGGAGGASGGQVHPQAYSSGIGDGHPKPAPPPGYHTYKGANGQWWFAPNS